MEGTLRIFPVTGPPGAGKSTALAWLTARNRWLARFGVRDYGLSLAEAGHPLGLTMRQPLLRGELLPDDLVRREFAHFLAHLPSSVRSVAVEGYPRNLCQCADLTGVVAGSGAALAGLIVLELSDDAVRSRVAGRLVCARCGVPVPSSAGGCPACGGRPVRRHDDSPDRLAARLREFRALNADVRSYFENSRTVYAVDGTRSPDQVRKELSTLMQPATIDIDPARGEAR